MKDLRAVSSQAEYFPWGHLVFSFDLLLSGGNQHFETLPSFSSHWHPREKRKGRKQQTELMSTSEGCLVKI